MEALGLVLKQAEHLAVVAEALRLLVLLELQLVVVLVVMVHQLILLGVQ
jgi:hypothetical protein